MKMKKKKRNKERKKGKGRLIHNDNEDDDEQEEEISTTGCLGMKKKPFNKRSPALHPPNSQKKPPQEQWSYHPPQHHGSGTNDKKYTPQGVELLWQPDAVTLYIYFVTNSTNPLTLEAAAAAIHNLTGCKWNVSFNRFLHSINFYTLKAS